MLKTRTSTKRLHLTEKRIAALTVPKQRTTLYDAKTQALGLKLEPSGVKSFFWFRAVPEEGQTSGAGKPTWKSIGPWPDISLDSARAKAEEYNVTLAEWRKEGCRGPNPFRNTAEKTDLTFGKLMEAYIIQYLAREAKNPARASDADRWRIEKYAPEWKPRAASSITREDVIALRDKIAARIGVPTANRLTEQLRRTFNWGRKANLLKGENPAEKIERGRQFREEPRERFLQPDEMVRLYKALDATPNTDARDFFTLALETAARCGNLCAMRWDEINWALATWTIPDPKNESPQTVELTKVALAVLKARHRRRRETENPWVFATGSKSGHLEDPKNAWYKIIATAKIKGATIHDLRRTRASYMAIAGESLTVIGSALGHRDAKSTQVYARLHQQAVREAQAAGAAKMRAMMARVPRQLAPSV